MKLLVFAHVPPPHHGQSYMVSLMLHGLENGASDQCEAPAIECFHVNARFSSDLGDVGGFRVGKILAIFRFCAHAVLLRFRHDVRNFYYVPAPAQRTPLLRDWLVMLMCRPFFSRLILHWHAVGLGEWIETRAGWFARRVTRWLMGRADLAIVLSEYNRADAEKLCPRRVAVVANGIPDPCPDYATRVAPRRAARRRVRQALLDGFTPTEADLGTAGDEPRIVNVLFLALCTREKGLFDALGAVELANRDLSKARRGIMFRLAVAGTFVNKDEQAEFESRAAMLPEAERPRYAGFVSGEAKDAALAGADIFCFPTSYRTEGQPVNLIEAMAHGLPILTTRWRAIPELFDPGYMGLVDPGDPSQLATALAAVARRVDGEKLREKFHRSLSVSRHIRALRAALLSAEAAE